MMNVMKILQNYINNSSKSSEEKSLIERISKRLIETEFITNHSIISEALRYVIKNVLPTMQKVNL